MSLLADHNLPFAAALGIMVLLAVAQLLGVSDMLDGTDAELDIDADLDTEMSAVGAVDGLM